MPAKSIPKEFYYVGPKIQEKVKKKACMYWEVFSNLHAFIKQPGLGPTECGRHFHSVVSLCWDQPFLRLCPGLWATVQCELFW